MFKSNEIKSVLEKLNHKDEVILTGRLTDEELNTWLSGAIALTYIPYFEGFGIPLLEAMRCKTPILTSNVTSLPEVGSDAAIYTNPESIDDIANGMNILYGDDAIRRELIEKGQKRLKDFSWDKSAKLLWESIQKTIHS